MATPLPSALCWCSLPRSLCSLAPSLLSVRAPCVGACSWLGLRPALYLSRPSARRCFAPFVARPVCSGWAGARSRSQSFLPIIHRGAPLPPGTPRVATPLPSAPQSAVLGSRSGACSPRLRVPWLPLSPPPRVFYYSLRLCSRGLFARVPARACVRLPRPLPSSPFGLRRLAPVPPCGRAPLRCAPGRGLLPRLPSTTYTWTRYLLTSLGTPASLSSSDGRRFLLIDFYRPAGSVRPRGSASAQGGVYGGSAPMPPLKKRKSLAAGAAPFSLICSKKIPKSKAKPPVLRLDSDLAPTNYFLYLCGR